MQWRTEASCYKLAQTCQPPWKQLQLSIKWLQSSWPTLWWHLQERRWSRPTRQDAPRLLPPTRREIIKSTMFGCNFLCSNRQLAQWRLEFYCSRQLWFCSNNLTRSHPLHNGTFKDLGLRSTLILPTLSWFSSRIKKEGSAHQAHGFASHALKGQVTIQPPRFHGATKIIPLSSEKLFPQIELGKDVDFYLASNAIF